MTDSKRFSETRQKLGEVSPSFCLAKWLQVSLLLQNGDTHSCHHAVVHGPTPEEELAEHPDAIHNSRFKMLRRKEMLEGKRPPECAYCWKLEDISPELVSDRMVKSSEDWALPRFDEIRGQPWDWRVIPSYVEVSFSNTCNFACAYCGPQSSSKWVEEMRRHGAFPLLPKDMFYSLESREALRITPIPEGERNPYVEAFWKWWPELYPRLKVFRITGGEPLLTRNTFRVLDYVAAHPRPDMELAVNSNLGAPSKLIDEFAEKLEAITAGGKVKSFSLYTSIDTWGEQAEYIRYGMDFEAYWQTVKSLLRRLKQVQLVFICTTNVLSVPGLPRLLEGIAELKRECGLKGDTGQPRVMVDLPYLRNPPHLNAQILPRDFVPVLERCLEFVQGNLGERGFHELERIRMLRLLEWVKAPMDPGTLEASRTNFFRFITAYDERRGLSCRKTFPELGGFFDECENLLFSRMK